MNKRTRKLTQRRRSYAFYREKAKDRHLDQHLDQNTGRGLLRTYVYLDGTEIGDKNGSAQH